MATADQQQEPGVEVGPKMLQMHTEIKVLRETVSKMETDRARFAALTAQTDSELSSSALSSRDGRLRAGLGENCPLVWVDAGTRANFSLWALVFSLDLPEVVAVLRTGCEEHLDVRIIADEKQSKNVGMRGALAELRAARAQIALVPTVKLMFDKGTQGYRQVADADEVVGHDSHMRLKCWLVDCLQEPDGSLALNEASGVVTGSFNPTKFSLASI
jgi:hypothetical protein